MSYKIGNGFDVHAFKFGRKLFLGGVELQYERGLEGHSDADVLIHSLCDAILGALGLGDIGKHFPDSDPEYKDKRSTFFLEKVASLLKEKKAVLQNADCTVIAQEPKIADYVENMKATMSKYLGITPDLINVKGTTTECLGFTGRKEGIACFSQVLLEIKN